MMGTYRLTHRFYKYELTHPNSKDVSISYMALGKNKNVEQVIIMLTKEQNSLNLSWAMKKWLDGYKIKKLSYITRDDYTICARHKNEVLKYLKEKHSINNFV